MFLHSSARAKLFLEECKFLNIPNISAGSMHILYLKVREVKKTVLSKCFSRFAGHAR
jgi:hypothetical protein